MINIDLYFRTPMEMLSDLGKNAKARRKALHLTQKEVSEKAGIPLATYRRFEQTGNISSKSLIMISIVLDENKKLSELFTEKRYRTIEDVLND